MSIPSWRRKIDRIDRQLVRLLNRRARCSLAIGRLKQAAGLRLFSHQREREIAENVRRASRGPMPHHSLQRLFQEMLRETRKAVRIALRRERLRARRPKVG